MKKLWLGIVGLATLAVCSYFVATSIGQQRLGSEIELLPPTTVGAGFTNAGSGSWSTGITSPRPRGLNVKVNKRLMGVVQVKSAPSGGLGNSLDVYLESSADHGLTWLTFGHLNITGAGTYYVPLSVAQDAVWPTAPVGPISDGGALGNNTITQYGLGERLRAKYNAAFVTNSTGSWSFHVFVVPD